MLRRGGWSYEAKVAVQSWTLCMSCLGARNCRNLTLRGFQNVFCLCWQSFAHRSCMWIGSETANIRRRWILRHAQSRTLMAQLTRHRLSWLGQKLAEACARNCWSLQRRRSSRRAVSRATLGIRPLWDRGCGHIWGKTRWWGHGGNGSRHSKLQAGVPQPYGDQQGQAAWGQENCLESVQMRSCAEQAGGQGRQMENWQCLQDFKGWELRRNDFLC